MAPFIKNSLGNSMDYAKYKALIKQLVASNSTTGNHKSESHVQHTKLNSSRIKRWDKTIELSKDAENIIKQIDHPMTWLVISESWCGDSAHILPVLNKVAELSDFINLRIVLRDDNQELMNAFSANNNQAIPKVLMIDDETGDVIGTYGPRPSIATTYVNRFLSRHGVLTPDFKEDLQHWYNNDKGQNIINDITKMLSEFKSNVYQ